MEALLGARRLKQYNCWSVHRFRVSILICRTDLLAARALNFTQTLTCVNLSVKGGNLDEQRTVKMRGL